MRKIITIVLIILICLIVGGIAFVLTADSVSSQGKSESGKGAEATVTPQPEHKNTVAYTLGDSIITNIKDSRKYLKMKVTFEIKDEKSKEYYDKNSYKMKDIIINVLRNKAEAELTAPEAQQSLKEDIRGALASQLDINSLIGIYIDEFVIQ